jgi:hypothetical protein
MEVREVPAMISVEALVFSVAEDGRPAPTVMARPRDC